MAFCPRCGAEPRPNAKFCHRCGKDVTDVYRATEDSWKPKVERFEGKSLKGSLEECWRKDFKAMGIKKGFPLFQIALDAKRIVFSAGGKKEIHIFNFDGAKERSIKIGGFGTYICSIAATSDCSRILVWTPRMDSGKIFGYTPEGQRELEVKMVEEVGGVATSLDGRLSVATSKEYVKIWEWNGNVLGHFRASGQFLSLVGAAKWGSYDIAPNGCYIAFTRRGYSGGDVSVVRTPQVDDLLKISDDNERSKIWLANMSVLDVPFKWSDSVVSTANNRLALIKERSICIFDSIGNKISRLLYECELVSKPELIGMARLTSNGKYLYYTSRNWGKKKMSFNIFNVENKTVIGELLTFPETDAYFCPSHDGSKLITVVGRKVSMFNVD